MLVKRQKGESQNGGKKKTKQAEFSEKRTFLTSRCAHLHVCLSGWKKCSFFEKLGLLCFVTSIFIINLMPYYRRINALFSASFIKSSYAKEKTGIHSLQRFTLAVLNFTKWWIHQVIWKGFCRNHQKTLKSL